MSPVDETVWEIEPHTLAKHAILGHYLKAWFPILANRNRRIVYFDGFAGPGIYKGGEPGSPIVALDIARNHRVGLSAEIVFWFIESRMDRYRNLVEQITPLIPKLPKNFRVHHQCCEFDEAMDEILGRIDAEGGTLAPSLVFIDPFGFSGMPMSVIKRIMKNKRCEILLTFMSRDIDRFKIRPELEETFNTLFGTSDWMAAFEIENHNQRLDFIRALYKRQLEDVAGIRYVRAFEMLDEHDMPIYSLFHGTNSVKGLYEMKTAFWNIDETGLFRFSDRTIEGQSRLFGSDLTPLKEKLLREKKGRSHSVKDLDAFVIVETPYLPKHLNGVLRELESANPPRILVRHTGSRRAKQYPRDRTWIEFV